MELPKTTFLSVLGLTIGLASGLLILAGVRHELGTDGFHAKANSIYRAAYRVEDAISKF